MVVTCDCATLRSRTLSPDWDSCAKPAFGDCGSLFRATKMCIRDRLNGVTDRGDGQTPDYRFRIWVSCADYMNDPLEGVFFRKCLHEAFLRYQSAHDLPDKSGYMPFAFTALNLNRQTFYAFSLSEHADSLPMWVAYGNNCLLYTSRCV